MKKINKFVICLIVVLLLCFIVSCDEVTYDDSTLDSSSEPCLHEAKTVIEEVESTCVSDGYIKYKCISCGQEFTDVIREAIHDYVTVYSKDANCQSFGYTIEECTLCKNRIKIEGTTYGSHVYYSNHICKYCDRQDPSKPCFTITSWNILPYRADYYIGGRLSTSVEILSVEPKFDGTKWYVQLKLKKTYDSSGYTGDYSVHFYYEIKNANDEIVYRANKTITSKFVGDIWTYNLQYLDPGDYTIYFMRAS